MKAFDFQETYLPQRPGVYRAHRRSGRARRRRGDGRRRLTNAISSANAQAEEAVRSIA